MVLAFGDGLELDTAQFELRRAGRRVPVEPQVFDVLAYLVSHRDRVVSKDELKDAVWGGRFVAETAVTSRIKQVRHALGDDGQTQGVVRTVHGRGYRFVAPVQDRDVVHPAAPRPSSGAQAPIRYTVSDGLHIAYQVSGGGDRDIVLIPGFICWRWRSAGLAHAVVVSGVLVSCLPLPVGKIASAVEYVKAA